MDPASRVCIALRVFRIYARVGPRSNRQTSFLWLSFEEPNTNPRCPSAPGGDTVASEQQEDPHAPIYHFRCSFERGDRSRRTSLNIDTMGMAETLRFVPKVEGLKLRN
jgi:hypothetical protein